MTKAIRKLKNNVQRILAWSYSRWKDYDKCPAYAKFKHVEKRQEPDGPASEHGKNVHKASEDFIVGRVKKLSPEFSGFRAEFAQLLESGAKAEQEWAFTAEWERCDWFDMRRCWVRIKVDIVHLQERRSAGGKRSTTVRVVDIKSGKMHADHEMQRSLYAVGALLIYPDAERVVVEHWYIDAQAKESSEFKAAELPKLQREWQARVVPMMADKRFAPRPGNYCRYCYYRNGNGGPCQY